MYSINNKSNPQIPNSQFIIDLPNKIQQPKVNIPIDQKITSRIEEEYCQSTINCKISLNSEINKLIEALNINSEKIKVAIIEEIGNLGKHNILPDDAIKVLFEYLKNTSIKIRIATALALNEQRNLDFKIIQNLIAFMQNEKDPVAKSTLILVLGKKKDLGKDIVDILISYLKNQSIEIKTAAVWTLQEQRNLEGEAIPSLIALIQNEEDSIVKFTAILILGKKKDLAEDVIDMLIPGLKNTDIEVKASTAWTLAEQHNNLPFNAILALSAALKDESDRALKVFAAFGLGRQETGLPREAIDALQAASQSEFIDVREMAIWALKKHGYMPQNFIPVVPKQDEWVMV